VDPYLPAFDAFNSLLRDQISDVWHAFGGRYSFFQFPLAGSARLRTLIS